MSSSDSSSSSSSSSQQEYHSEASEYDPELLPLDTLIDTVVDYDPPSLGWEHVRIHLRSHSIEETKSSIERKGEFDTTALHVACRNDPPSDVLDVMIMAAPDMIYWADSFGWLPLHYACANGADIEIVRMLVDAYPDSRLVTDKRGRTPLHFALGNVECPPTAELVRLLVGKRKECVRWPDENQMLPLHYACAYGAPVEVCSVLIECWEEGLGKMDMKGRNALHFAMVSSIVCDV
jgi:ankyrin repeat protein